MSGNCDDMAFFSIYGQFGAIFNTTLTLLLWGKVLSGQKIQIFLQKMMTSAKLRGPWS